MIAWFINIGITLLAFTGMEGVAWLTHKYVMHGLCWTLHKDHHRKEHYSFLERNDFFFLIFAIPGIACLAIGTIKHIPAWTCVGTGITLYGACYFFVHDLFIHQRIKVLRNSENRYLRAIRRAHKIHHKHLGKEDGECFGMLLVPFKYFREDKT
ncbi:sterol desaturase family protein [Mucilaginibacter flavus]|uniref:sterol desaturase family protein n=1 Tax=Mucilaginibacter flavus TaxID=931504 RepID=UPI0025B35BDC|nr:sterol desaturase family protein [Mucilaginibacter flavus]MDN3584632.1 sterol desaturase family protein [Mucilaginibacter flavus]